jgi:Holliday junction resolvase RusA-like endonuclease
MEVGEVSEQPAVVINFPRPTSANKMFSRQVTRRGRRDLTQEYKAWRDEAGWLVKMQIVGLQTITSQFNIVIEVPRSSRVDLDNNVKPILDLATNMKIISDDRNCVGISITPADRSDCMAAFWPLPEMGAVRAPAGSRMRPVRPVMRRTAPKRRALTWLAPGKMPA